MRHLLGFSGEPDFHVIVDQQLCQAHFSLCPYKDQLCVLVVLLAQHGTLFDGVPFIGFALNQWPDFASGNVRMFDQCQQGRLNSYVTRRRVGSQSNKPMIQVVM